MFSSNAMKMFLSVQCPTKWCNVGDGFSLSSLYRRLPEDRWDEEEKSMTEKERFGLYTDW